jgi:plastocyanin
VKALAIAAAMAMPMPMPGHADEPGGPPASGAGGAETVVVGMKEKRFQPASLDVVLGDTVTWQNDDGVTHAVASAEGGFDSGRMGPGVRFSLTPTAQGTIPYHCSLHFFMTGHVTVHGLGLDAPRATARPGAPVTLTGRAPAGVAEVLLEQRAADGTWSTAARAAPSAGGRFSAAVTPTAPLVVRARSGDLLSRQVTVTTPPRVTAHAVRRGRRIVVRVTTTPAQPRARIRLERWKWERFDWRPAGVQARLDARSRATLVLRSAARQRLRVVVTRGVGGYGRGAGATMRIPRSR